MSQEISHDDSLKRAHITLWKAINFYKNFPERLTPDNWIIAPRNNTEATIKDAIDAGYIEIRRNNNDLQFRVTDVGYIMYKMANETMQVPQNVK